MKLWLVNPYALPPDEMGGLRHYTLARELVRKGHDVTIIASNVHYSRRTRMESHQGVEVIGGVRFVWIPSRPYKGNGLSRLINNLEFTARLLASPSVRSLPRPEAILGSSPHPFGAWAAERLATRYGVPYLYEIRDLWPQSLVDLGQMTKNHPLVKIMAWLERYLIRRAENVVTLLPRVGDYIEQLGFSKDKSRWIPNGVDLSLIPTNKAVPDQRFTVLYAGSHGVSDQLELLLDAARIVQGVAGAETIQLRLIGDGPAKEGLIARAESMGLENVSFDPAVSKSAIYDELGKAHAFVAMAAPSPLYKWGLSFNKLFDYLAMERPVILSAASPMNPVEASNGGIVVPPGNASALADAILKVASMSEAERAVVGRRGRQYVEEQHDFTQLAHRLEILFENVVVANR